MAHLFLDNIRGSNKDRAVTKVAIYSYVLNCFKENGISKKALD